MDWTIFIASRKSDFLAALLFSIFCCYQLSKNIITSDSNIWHSSLLIFQREIWLSNQQRKHQSLFFNAGTRLINLLWVLSGGDYTSCDIHHFLCFKQFFLVTEMKTFIYLCINLFLHIDLFLTRWRMFGNCLVDDDLQIKFFGVFLKLFFIQDYFLRYSCIFIYILTNSKNQNIPWSN